MKQLQLRSKSLCSRREVCQQLRREILADILERILGTRAANGRLQNEHFLIGCWGHVPSSARLFGGFLFAGNKRRRGFCGREWTRENRSPINCNGHRKVFRTCEAPTRHVKIAVAASQKNQHGTVMQLESSSDVTDLLGSPYRFSPIIEVEVRRS